MPGTVHNEVFNCTPAEFFKIVSDYESYPQFLQEVKGCKVLKIEGNKKLVELTVSVVKSFSYQLWMTESEPTSIVWHFASGDIFKTNDGSWKLEEMPGGKTKATYSVDATFGVFVPGMITKALVSVNLPTMMAAYHKRVKEKYGK